ncbi:hypothetical protein B005_3455 [Nocardiopsis alba ATCC BAA-2165]|uniref:Uncharacterized protein n=1 Tax=Nocardiopsis alba (strain ATCC BAA-2165 / BE74) TaxID=1205910 RepID=J7L6U6_NOCAA|nr:hypothetical protein B005_3455 [Nocardiopsis alba ATCC BAA-2165]
MRRPPWRNVIAITTRSVEAPQGLRPIARPSRIHRPRRADEDGEE